MRNLEQVIQEMHTMDDNGQEIIISAMKQADIPQVRLSISAPARATG